MPRHRLPSLHAEPWLNEPRLRAVMEVLNASGGEVRVVGGAVRNALLGIPVADIDLATTLLPDQVMQLARAAKFGVHATGLDHGTITISHKGAAFEVTTLRKDVETNGRHAVVSFTTDWAMDAQRRDFTINALYCDISGLIYDFTNGYEDVRKRKVRFVGLPSQRIREDYLRILRFFRFHAHYGKGAPDEAGLKACVRLRAGLKSLSAERVRQELLKMLAATEVVPTLKQLAQGGILKFVLPHTDDWNVLRRLPVDAILRLYVLAREPMGLQATLKLSNAEANRIAALHQAPALSPRLPALERRRIFYHLGVATWRDAVELSRARSGIKIDDPDWQDLLALPEHWALPLLPIKGSDVLQAGVSSGPAVGRILLALEDWWIANDFKPTQEELFARIGRYKDAT